jgi:hypothetical protein
MRRSPNSNSNANRFLTVAVQQCDRLRLPRGWAAKAAGGFTVRRRLTNLPHKHPSLSIEDLIESATDTSNSQYVSARVLGSNDDLTGTSTIELVEAGRIGQGGGGDTEAAICADSCTGPRDGALRKTEYRADLGKRLKIPPRCRDSTSICGGYDILMDPWKLGVIYWIENPLLVPAVILRPLLDQRAICLGVGRNIEREIGETWEETAARYGFDARGDDFIPN